MAIQSIWHEAPPRVSIGMPVYNGAQWLEEALHALRAQTLPDFELIISDNASTDRTQSICARHAAEDGRIRYYRNARNVGASRNYMALVALARAEYFKWASSNDLCHHTFLDRCVAALEAEPDAVLAYPKTMLFKNTPDDGALYEGDLCVMQESAASRFAYVLCNMELNNAMSGGLFRTSMLRRVHSMGSFRAADIVMMGELALLGKFVQIPERLFFRRMSKESATPMRSRVEVERHFEPDATSPLRWQHWKYRARVLRSALVTAPLGPEKMAAVMFALKSIVWSRSELMGDVMEAIGNGR